jgi:hypothetical protein
MIRVWAVALCCCAAAQQQTVAVTVDNLPFVGPAGQAVAGTARCSKHSESITFR